MSVVNTYVKALNQDEFRDAFAEMVDNKISELRSGGWLARRRARKLEKSVDDPTEFEVQFQLALHRSVDEHLQSPRATEAFTTGDFLDWFKDGGWESLLQFFEGILEMISKYFG